MNVPKIIRLMIVVGVVLGLATAGFLTRGLWYDRVHALFTSKAEAKEADPHAGHAHASQDRIELSPQAEKSLRLDVQPVQITEKYPRTIEVPVRISERPGKSDLGISSPLPGVVKDILAVPGEVVRPGQALFTIRVISEHLQTSQRELFLVVREQGITQQERDRLEKIGGAIPQSRLLELDYQLRRLNAKEMAYRFELAARGLNEEQIEGITKGDFIREVTIRVPSSPGGEDTLAARLVRAPLPGASPTPERSLDVKALMVHPGDQVEAGKPLGILSEHEVLYVEGRVFKHEIDEVRKAMTNEWPVSMRLVRSEEKGQKPIPSLQILFIGNEVDPESQTIPVYVPLSNGYEIRTEGERQFRTWRFRPSQRVFLQIPVEYLKDVIVLPTDAVVREGAEHYVFVQNGDAFERKEVQVIYSDQENVVLANDGVLIPGASYVAHHGAARLHRALQMQSSSGNIDPHHGHMH